MSLGIPSWPVSSLPLQSLTGEPLLLSTKKATILDDDRPTITLSVDDTSITEGDTATFTLTRGHNTANELLVGVSVDDPGGFLEGNYASEAVAVPSSIMFAAGETTKEVAITVPDDWRDVPDNAITFTVAAEPHYDIVGSSFVDRAGGGQRRGAAGVDQLQPRGG